MTANEYRLICKCVEDGITDGWNRAHKHQETPSPETIRNQIEIAVMGEICHWFTFPDTE